MASHDGSDGLVGLLFNGRAPSELTFLAFAAFIAGLARGFSGFGAALIFMPLASATVGPQVAAPLLLIIDGFAALGMLPNAWRRANKGNVATMAVGAFVGVPLGALVLANADPLAVRWAIVAIVAALLALLMSGWRYHGKPSQPATVGVGLIAGVFSGIAQAGGPPVVAYWLGGAVPHALVRANIILYFAISTVFSFASYAAGGLFATSLVGPVVASGPLYAIGLFLGSKMFSRADERVFRRICYGLIATAAVLSLPLLDPLFR